MTIRLICPQGHQWTGPLSSRCPECGAPGQVDLDPTALDVGTRVQGAPLTQSANRGSDATPPLPVVPGCEVLGEIARGGMGVIYRAHDTALGRDLALKVLRPDLVTVPDMCQRFLDEAQVGGQLQHPGIVPVYHVGVAGDGRPCFTMKLVQGRTFGDLLRERPTPSADQAMFLGIFEQVCQALAYAHDHGVIHRDLKPDNIMIGPFGEVLVMDWGLARVLEWARRGVRTVRTVAGASPSEAGSILGTPAYMAPEQARGESDRLDERADVFGLGAILCEILTGAPPYVGSSSWEVANQAAQADLAPALVRLETCGADASLLHLVRNCLAVDRDARPRDAGLVAVRLVEYRAAVMARAAGTRIQESIAPSRPELPARSTRRRFVLVASLALGLVLAGLLGFGWREATLRRDEQAARQEERIRQDEARSQATATDLRQIADRRSEGHLAEAWLILARAEGRYEEVGNPPAGLKQARAGLEADQRDRDMLDRLDAIRRQASGRIEGKEAIDQLYRRAFAGYGLDVEDRPVAHAAQAMQVSPLRGPLVASLDAWARVAPAVRAQHLRTLASQVDADPWQRQVRALDPKTDSLELLRLAEKPQATSPTGALLLGDALDQAGECARALTLLQQAQRHHPEDLSLAWALAARLLVASPVAAPQGVRYLTLAVGLNPENVALRIDLADALVLAGLRDEAIDIYQDALRLERTSQRARASLAAALLEEGRCAEALGMLRSMPMSDPDTLREWERLAQLEARLPAYRAGTIMPQSAAEAADLGRLCRLKRLFAAAAGFYVTAFALDPALADPQRPPALAAAARASADANLTEVERAHYRLLARAWLQDELSAGKALLTSGKMEERAAAASRLRALFDDVDLAGVRAPDALAALPDVERKDWESLWHDLGTLWQRTQKHI
jgi:eukaryotic-like serine/threonine-protein kinase